MTSETIRAGKYDMATTQEHRPSVESVDQKSRKFSLEMLDKRRPSMSGMVFSSKSDKERKIGHRRVDETGQVTYKKRPTSELMAAIQLGIGQSVGSLSPKPMRDVLYEDFHVVETVFFPKEGSNLTPGHRGNDFRFKTYAPIAFRYFRELFKIRPEDFLLSLCDEPLRELSNPGASGSIFYITIDDEFIVKTVQHKEAEFLQKLLPGYYMNLNQNPCTLLPKFYGLYCYQCGGKNIRFVIMNNLLPSSIRLHEKYDLKGSTHKRKASKQEKNKATPTLKDLDFMELHADGVILEADTYNALTKTIDRDCRVLESFKIMDYSLLLGIQNLSISNDSQNLDDEQESEVLIDSSAVLLSGRPVPRPRLAQYSTAMEAIQAYTGGQVYSMPGGIPAINTKGDHLLLYIGIIDILQSYRFTKKFEHAVKSLVHDGDTISVHHPGFYAQRFQNFFAHSVFRTKQSQVKRKSIAGRKSLVPSENSQKFFSSFASEGPVSGKRPDVLPRSTPTQDTLTSSSTTAFADVHRTDAVTANSSSSAPKSISHETLAVRPTSFYKQHKSEEFLATSKRLTLSASAYSLAASTPTHTQHTDATMSYTVSSVSVVGSSNPSNQMIANTLSSSTRDILFDRLSQLPARSPSLSADAVSLDTAIEDEMTRL